MHEASITNAQRLNTIQNVDNNNKDNFINMTEMIAIEIKK